MSLMIETRVLRIPCQIKVTHYFRQKPLGPRADSDLDCYGWEDIEFQVCDLRGNPAPWLERKLSEDDRNAIENLIRETIECQKYEP